MARQKDYAVVSVLKGLNKTQAANIQRDIMKSKMKHAPESRGIAAVGPIENVGLLLKYGMGKHRLKGE